MRQWVTPRSLMLHVAFIIIAGGCLIAGWWQVHRAMQGNTLSYMYSVEWPAFAVVAGIGWWQMFHDTPDDIKARKAFHQRMRVASAEVVARTLPRSARAITVGSDEIEGRFLPSGSAASAPALGDGTDTYPTAGVAVRGVTDLVPVGPHDSDAVLLAREGSEDAPANEMTDYNQYLASLAVYGKPKTWRNPRGL